ncbi:GTPase [Christiangramia sp.]|uniref:GTPase n=1 Tax=Christiangramia sp. TaxID=1931228 RepID=UPI0026045A28|nr:GTPase [Christiangramia sp.]
MEKLIFVYNADSGKINLYKDILHKVISPKTYPCSLCDITHGVLKEREEWKRFRENAQVEMEFLHKDEFQKEYASKFGHTFEFPVILAQTDKGLEVFMSRQDLSEIKDEVMLIKEVKTRLINY